MATAQPLEFRWGIIATGKISTKFVQDLLVDPKSRDVHDLVHKVTAIGSRSTESAQKFIDTVAGGDKTIKAYGSYEEVYADQNVDAVYIGTPHTMHYDNAMAAIKAGKHLLVEKPITVNAAELRSLIEAAKQKGVFLMEALWTRFHPLAKEVRQILDQGSLGRPITVHADMSGDFDLKNIPTTHRILDPKLGGGALLDLGPYSLLWAIIALFEDSSNDTSTLPAITSAMLTSPVTGADTNTSFTLTFPSIPAQAILSCSINVGRTDTGAIIRCEKGLIKIASPLYRPTEFSVHQFDKTNSRGVGEGVVKKFEYVGGGWHYQADEVARCVRAGKGQSEIWSHDKSLFEMTVFDSVRKQGGYILPPGVEKVLGN